MVNIITIILVNEVKYITYLNSIKELGNSNMLTGLFFVYKLIGKLREKISNLFIFVFL